MRHSVDEVDDDSQSTIYLRNEEEIPSHAILSLNVKNPCTLTEKGNNADAQVLGSGKIRANNLWDVSRE
ncbi:hypothetical protein ACFX11_026049 [Malus domestica]